MPIQRLNERPTRNCTLQDITCDSDGKIANFAVNGGQSNVLPVHVLRKNEPYYIGVFLVGAYQEILGDMHNLFGDTTAAHISVTDDGYKIDQIIDGETVAEVLEYVQYNPKKLVRQTRAMGHKERQERKVRRSKKAKSSSATTVPDSTATPIWNSSHHPHSSHLQSWKRSQSSK